MGVAGNSKQHIPNRGLFDKLLSSLSSLSPSRETGFRYSLRQHQKDWSPSNAFFRDLEKKWEVLSYKVMVGNIIRVYVKTMVGTEGTVHIGSQPFQFSLETAAHQLLISNIPHDVSRDTLEILLSTLGEVSKIDHAITRRKASILFSKLHPSAKKWRHPNEVHYLLGKTSYTFQWLQVGVRKRNNKEGKEAERIKKENDERIKKEEEEKKKKQEEERKENERKEEERKERKEEEAAAEEERKEKKRKEEDAVKNKDGEDNKKKKMLGKRRKWRKKIVKR